MNVFNYNNFKKKLEEHALYFDQLQRFDNYLSNISDEKEFLKNITSEMDNFKKIIMEFNNDGKFNFKLKKDDEYFVGTVIYNNRIKNIIEKLLYLIEDIDNTDLKDKTIKIIYGTEYEMDFHPEFQINTKNFNRIDINNEIPYFIRNIGVGKALYKMLINKRDKNGLILGYISSNYDASKDAKFVWDSLRQDKDLYTCIKDLSVICFSNKCSKDTIENVLRKWLRDAKDYEIDRDLMLKYPDLNITK